MILYVLKLSYIVKCCIVTEFKERFVKKETFYLNFILSMIAIHCYTIS